MRHLNGQFDNYQSRVVTVPGSAIAMDPVVTLDGLFFTALVQDSFLQFPIPTQSTYLEPVQLPPLPPEAIGSIPPRKRMVILRGLKWPPAAIRELCVFLLLFQQILRMI